MTIADDIIYWAVTDKPRTPAQIKKALHPLVVPVSSIRASIGRLISGGLVRSAVSTDPKHPNTTAYVRTPITKA